MSSPITKVAIAGATGSLGSVITAELVKAGFEVTALTRDASKAKLPSSVKAVSVDYNDLDSLKSALQGQHAVISTLGSQGIGQQELLIDAAIASGVQKILPSDFGSDYEHPENRALPVFKDKVELEEYLHKKVAGTSTTYTNVANNAFLDWGIGAGFLLNVKEKKANLYDGGDISFTATPLYLIGQAVASVLRHPQETANRQVRVHGTTLTINSLLQLVQEQTGKDGWTTEQYDTIEHVKQAYVALKEDPSNFYAWGFPMIFRSALGKGLDTDWSKNNDNALLGIKALTDEEVREIVKTSVAKLI